MRNRISLAMPFLIFYSLASRFRAISAYTTEPPVVKVVNPLTGHEWFNFVAENKTIGDTFGSTYNFLMSPIWIGSNHVNVESNGA